MKKLVILIGIILIVIVSISMGIDRYLNQKIPSLVNEKTPYKIELNQFSSSVFRGVISAKDVSISTDKSKNAPALELLSLSGQKS